MARKRTNNEGCIYSRKDQNEWSNLFRIPAHLVALVEGVIGEKSDEAITIL